jgi:hypothetical protein
MSKELCDCCESRENCAFDEIERLRRIEALALEYVHYEMDDDHCTVEEGAALHELAKALGLVK